MSGRTETWKILKGPSTTEQKDKQLLGVETDQPSCGEEILGMFSHLQAVQSTSGLQPS